MADLDELTKQRQMNNLLNEMKELVPILEDKNVQNIFIVGSGRVFYEHFKDGNVRTDIIYSPSQVQKIINFIAAMQNKVIGEDGIPVLEALLPRYNFRITAVCDDWTQTPELTIRRPTQYVIPLVEWYEKGQITQEHYELIIDLIKNKKNIVIAGATSSGKTTFLNSCIQTMIDFYPEDRNLIIEDTPEIICNSEPSSIWHIRKNDAQRAMELAMRWTMKRLIFGEIRNGLILKELIEIWGTGHHGNFTTIHSDSAAQTVDRMKGLLASPDFADAKNRITSTIDYIVYLKNKKVEEIMAVSAIDDLSKTIEEYENTQRYEEGFNAFLRKNNESDITEGVEMHA